MFSKLWNNFGNTRAETITFTYYAAPPVSLLFGMSFEGSKKGTRTTSALTMPSLGSWTLRRVPRSQWVCGRAARAMLDSRLGDQKALVT